MFAAYQPRAASAYQRINVETSMHTIDQHQLVSLLYEGVLSSIAAARGALARGDVAGKCNGVSKAVRIIEEGLMTGLDRDDIFQAGALLLGRFDHVAEPQPGLHVALIQLDDAQQCPARLGFMPGTGSDDAALEQRCNVI